VSTDDSITIEINMRRLFDLGTDSRTANTAITIQIEANLIFHFVH
jgi:hypothetical protein